MRWRGVTPIACAVLILATCSWNGAPAGEAGIFGLEDQRIHVMITGDLDALDGILADDPTYVHSNGRLESKTEFLARLGSGDLKYRAMAREDVTMRLLGCAAVVTGRAALEVESKGEVISLPVRFTDVYVRRAGRWRTIAWHSSRIR